MKLGKEEIQKLVLGVMLVLGVIYSYFDLLLSPLRKRQAATRTSAAALGPEITAAQAQIHKSEELEKIAPQQTLVIKQVNALIPEGSPVAWFPPRIADFFKRHGIEKVSTKFTSEAPEKELANYRKMAWSIDVPKTEFTQLATAICALENEEPLIEITSVQIDASRDDMETQHAVIVAHNLVQQ